MKYTENGTSFKKKEDRQKRLPYCLALQSTFSVAMRRIDTCQISCCTDVGLDTYTFLFFISDHKEE